MVYFDQLCYTPHDANWSNITKCDLSWSYSPYPPNHRRIEPSLNINVVNCTNYTDLKKSNLSKLLSSFKKKYMSTWESGYGLPHCPSHYD